MQAKPKSRKVAWVVLGVVMMAGSVWLICQESTEYGLHDEQLRKEPLHFAALRNDVATLTRLVAEGHDVNRRCKRASSRVPLLVVIARQLSGEGQGEIWRAGDTPLHVATLQRQTAAIRTLLGLGADPSIKNSHGLTALDVAKLWGDSESIKMLSGQRP